MVYFLTHDLYNIASINNSHHKNFKSYDHGDQVYEVVWSWSLQRFGSYLAYNASILNDATNLTLDLNKQQTAFFYHGDQVEQVVRSWNLQYSLQGFSTK
jgi:hypothetical protein